MKKTIHIKNYLSMCFLGGVLLTSSGVTAQSVANRKVGSLKEIQTYLLSGESVNKNTERVLQLPEGNLT